MENDCTELAEETIVNQPFHLNVQIEVLANLLYFFYEVTILLFKGIFIFDVVTAF